ncbi:MAG: hypothetical protein AAFN77_00485 [Planctomycetota bacterium]
MKTSFPNCPANTIMAVVVLATVLVFTGCGPSMPEIVPVSGTITVNGEPYESVEVKFYPLQPGLDGNTIATGVTDKDGKYTLSLPGKDTPGACACECKVTISEGPIPDAVRGSGNDQIASTRYLASLKNRPVPVIYTRMADTPFTVTVSPDEETYDFDVKK